MHRLLTKKAWHLCQAFFVGSVILLNSSCTSIPSPQERSVALNNILVGSDIRTTETSFFTHKTALFQKSSSSDKLVVYIEGDGYAWKNRTTASTNPTPIMPVTATMASRDSRENVLYIARPCQYVNDNRCHKRFWTNERYSNDVIASFYEVIKIYMAENISSIEIFGYSGGGLIAMMVAGEYDLPVERIVTIASNIDHKEWTDYHKVSTLSGSRNISEVIEKLQNINQIHFSGGKDINVPYDLLRISIEKNNLGSVAKIINKAKFDHQCCWAKQWPELLHLISANGPINN